MGERRFAMWNAALILSGASLLSFLARTFLDYRFVYEEMNVETLSLALLTVFNLAFFAGWIWALVSASRSKRRGMVALLVYDVLLVLFGIPTLVSFCPSPCPTAWPIGEITIWSNLLVGFPAIVAVGLSLRRRAA